jgi:hypothetical protein
MITDLIDGFICFYQHFASTVDAVLVQESEE